MCSSSDVPFGLTASISLLCAKADVRTILWLSLKRMNGGSNSDCFFPAQRIDC